MRYIRVSKFCADSGYAEKDVRRNIQARLWTEGREYRRAPDGQILIDVQGVETWVERAPLAGQPPGSPDVGRGSPLHSTRHPEAGGPTAAAGAQALPAEKLSYSVTGAAKALGISARGVWRLIRSGDLASFKLGHRTLIRADVLRSFVDQLSGA